MSITNNSPIARAKVYVAEHWGLVGSAIVTWTRAELDLINQR
jgi:hypothetical protein